MMLGLCFRTRTNVRSFQFYKNHMPDDPMAPSVGAQLIMASATMPMNTTELLQTIIDPSTIHEVVSPQLHRIVPHIEQSFCRMNKMGRPVELLRLVRTDIEKRRPIIVFCNKSATSDYVSMFLNENGVGCVNLNGDMPADMRLGQFAKFQSGIVDVLATTDMASRGLDTTRVRGINCFCFFFYKNSQTFFFSLVTLSTTIFRCTWPTTFIALAEPVVWAATKNVWSPTSCRACEKSIWCSASSIRHERWACCRTSMQI